MTDNTTYGEHEVVINSEHPWNDKYNIREDKIDFSNSRLDWTVEERPLFVHDGDRLDIVDSHKMLMRSDTNRHLAVHNNSYGVIQNRQIWESLEEALAGVNYEIVGSGYVQGGRKAFVQAEVDDEKFTVNGEEFKNYVTAWTSHDGSTPYNLLDTTIRNVCRNTASASYRSGGKIFNLALRHTKNAASRISDMMQKLETIFDHRKKMFDDLQHLASMEVTPSDALAFTAGYLNGNNTELTTNAFNRSTEITKLFKNGIGNRGQTAYDLYNGFTEYYTHGNRQANDESSDRRNKQFLSSEYGTNAKIKANILDVLMDEQKRDELHTKGTALLQERNSRSAFSFTNC